MSQWHFYDPAEGHGLAHDPFKAIVAPRPIGWISSVDAEGRPNLAPYSFFNAVCDRPPMVMFASSARKDTRRQHCILLGFGPGLVAEIALLSIE